MNNLRVFEFENNLSVNKLPLRDFKEVVLSSTVDDLSQSSLKELLEQQCREKSWDCSEAELILSPNGLIYLRESAEKMNASTLSASEHCIYLGSVGKKNQAFISDFDLDNITAKADLAEGLKSEFKTLAGNQNKAALVMLGKQEGGTAPQGFSEQLREAASALLVA